ncbi:hypothetical protein BCR34DRAFT_173975 [Clohesyomyces aquaticus]|uniref:Uncharacterized protein n=1 Tax=Clohesyomyces aquaticus TaxID=1231657 RepID=A0A1Y1YG72_9PLEO|nr:hypothetical protein BCR34DRAFT_173975 [Clohesyomyces aquaticus]
MKHRSRVARVHERPYADSNASLLLETSQVSRFHSVSPFYIMAPISEFPCFIIFSRDYPGSHGHRYYHCSPPPIFFQDTPTRDDLLLNLIPETVISKRALAKPGTTPLAHFPFQNLALTPTMTKNSLCTAHASVTRFGAGMAANAASSVSSDASSR